MICANKPLTVVALTDMVYFDFLISYFLKILKFGS